MKNTACLSTILKIMRYSGIWMPDSFENKKRRYFYYVYSFIYQFTFLVILIITQVLRCIMVFGDIYEMIDASLLLLTNCAHLVKLVVVWLKQDKIKKLINILDGPSFTTVELHEQETLQKVSAKTLNLSNLYINSVFFTCTIWGILPLLSPVSHLPLNYPYISSSQPIFWFLYVYQVLTITLCGVAVAALDLLVSGLMSLISGQLEVLSYKLTHLGKTSAGDKDYLRGRATGSEVGAIDTKECEMVESCVKFHQKILSFIKDLDTTFGIAVFVQFLFSTIIICGTAFKISLCTEVMQYLAMIGYIICIGMELFLFCYFGDIVKQKNEQVIQEAYCSHWENMPVRAQKTFLLFIIRAQNAPTLSAGNIFEMTMMTFSTILRTSYSYFTVLTNKHNN